MDNKVETIPFKGYEIQIFQDWDCQSPEDWGDDNVFLVNYHRDFSVKRDEIISEDDVRGWYNGEKISQTKKFHFFKLVMLSHSGVWLRIESGFACDSQGWDTSRVGVVLVSKAEAKTKKKARELADGLVESWNNVLSGQVYGYQIDGIKDGGSCWGFYGDYNKSGLIDEAKAEIDGQVEKDKQKNSQRLRSYIKNGVSLNKRQSAKIW